MAEKENTQKQDNQNGYTQKKPTIDELVRLYGVRPDVAGALRTTLTPGRDGSVDEQRFIAALKKTTTMTPR
ncbi:MAG: hypothetical protein JXK07_09995 [Spirochaetes bacterium]|nr:hypothetical protein [Spirochaetota bacterium]MBN2771271.1 hypothetical protein [Spirochaetota bacterium]